jgi:hypothetical protein
MSNGKMSTRNVTLLHTGSTFYVVRTTSAKSALHADNMKFSTQNGQ